jgi:hypothetical protein
MNSSGAVANGIGQPVRRKEDLRLLTGKGRFADDFQLSGLAHAVIVRRPLPTACCGFRAGPLWEISSRMITCKYCAN